MGIEPVKRKRITLNDVAREAGVSVQTASHVLAGNMKVRLPDSTRERVRAAAKTVGYQANRIAQAMKTGKTQMVSVWMPIDRPNLTYLRTLQVLSRETKKGEYDMMVVGVDAQLAYSAEGRLPYQWPVDGIISLDAGKAVKAYRDIPGNDITPVVILGLEEFVNGDAVSWDVLEGSKEATRRLIAEGRKRILHVTLDWILRDFPREQRRRGYTEAMEEAGLVPEFLTIPAETSSATRLAMEDYLTSHAAPDGCTCFTDALAVGVASALGHHSIPIPEGCRIWGFGNYPEAEDYRVPISTMHSPLEDVVHQAWTWLRERIDDPTIPTRVVNLPMILVDRD